MSIKKLYQDIFEKVDYIDRNVENPFYSQKGDENPFAKFFFGTFVWVDPIDNLKEKQK